LHLSISGINDPPEGAAEQHPQEKKHGCSSDEDRGWHRIIRTGENRRLAKATKPPKAAIQKQPARS